MIKLDKYPNCYFEHFIAMMNEEITKENILENCDIALKFEGEKYLEGVKNEIAEIIKTSDKKYLSKLARKFKLKWMKLDMDKMELIDKTIIRYLK